MSTPTSLQAARMITALEERHADENRHWQGIPGIERTPAGKLLATWYTGNRGEGAGNFVIVVQSTDGGATWSKPFLVIEHADPSVRCYDECLWLDPDGRLWLFWAQSEGKFDVQAGVWAIRCDNPDATPQGSELAWTEPWRICNGVMMNKPVVLSSGEWALPAAVWGAIERDRRPDLAGEKFSNLVVSTDRGETWTRRGGADVPNRCFDEHMVVERRDGSLWMLVRRYDGVGEAISHDRGLTWTANPEPVLQGPNSRFFLRRLSDGELLLVNHAATDARRDLTAYISHDDGATWEGGLLLDERTGVSYPDGTQTPDGTIHIIYDYHRGDKYASGREREILLAQFTVPEVLEGQGGKLRTLVNRATGD